MREQQINLIIGASGGIATALCHEILKRDEKAKVIAVSRHDLPTERYSASQQEHIEWLICSQTDEAIDDVVRELGQYKGRIARVFICIGQLHGETYSPEKRLEDLTRSALARAFEINTIIPTLWLRHLMPLCSGDLECRIGIISARVGSIKDNRLGGWYSYRASKAALNMLVKTAAIEYARRAKNVKIAALHPGTVNTPLSRPFQDRVPEGKLFEPPKSAHCLIDQLDSSKVDGQAGFIAWDGETIPW